MQILTYRYDKILLDNQYCINTTVKPVLSGHSKID